MSIQPPTHILVIDEIPLIAVGLQECFRSIDPAIRVEHIESVFTALSAKSFENVAWQLIILGSTEENTPGSLLLPASELKGRFPGSHIMIYTGNYDPHIIEKMKETGIDAYVHKAEPVDEIRKAYQYIMAGEPYISGIFHTLFFDYRYGVKK